MSHILDDFIFLSPSEQVCQHYLQQFFSLAELLSIPVNHKKTVMPSTCVIVHGIEVDTVSMQARLPQDKLEAAVNLVRAYRRRRKVTLRELQSVIGTLAFACKVVIMGRPFLRRLIDLTIGIAKPHFHIRLRQEARLDLAAWALFLEHYNGTSLLLNDLWTSSEKLELFTDASGFGYAGLLDGQWFQGLWPPSWMAFNIAIKELFPIVLAIRLWPSVLTDRRLLVLSDNEAVVHIINNQTSKDKQLMSLIRTLTVSLMQNNVILRAKHVPGKTNVIADALSRVQDTPDLRRQYGLKPMQSVIPPDLLPWPL
jgi:hypothetical protein